MISSAGEDKKTVISREVPVSDSFLKHRAVDLKPTEVAGRVEASLAKQAFERARALKQARRCKDDTDTPHLSSGKS